MHMPYAETGVLARLNDALAAAAFSCAIHPPAGSVFSTIYAGLKSAICLQCPRHVLGRLWLQHGLLKTMLHSLMRGLHWPSMRVVPCAMPLVLLHAD